MYLRNSDWYDPRRYNPKVVIVGAGGIGSWVALLLQKLGVRDLTVIDGDITEPHNLSGTVYTLADLGKPKVQVLKSLLASRGGQMRAIQKFFRGSLPKADVLISAVDSMRVRKQLFDYAVKHKIPFFIDGRTGGEQWECYAIRPTKSADRRIYRRRLVTDDKTQPLSCSGEWTIDTNLAVATQITRSIRKWVVAKKYSRECIWTQSTAMGIIEPMRGPKARTKRPKPPEGPIVIEGGQHVRPDLVPRPEEGVGALQSVDPDGAGPAGQRGDSALRDRGGRH